MIGRKVGCRTGGLLVTIVLLASPSEAQTFRSSQSRLQWTIQGDVPVVLFAASMTAWARTFEKGLSPEDVMVRDPSSVNALDRIATRRWSPLLSRTSDGVLVAGMVSPIAVLSIQALARGLEARAWGIRLGVVAETVLVTAGVTQVVKVSVRRPRPVWFNPEAPDSARAEPDGRLSFWSGHTALVASALASLATVQWIDHPGSAEAWTSTALTAVVVPLMASLRVMAGKHYPTDVLAGGLVGVSLGIGVPLLHLRRPESRATARRIGPLPLGDGGGLLVSGEW